MPSPVGVLTHGLNPARSDLSSERRAEAIDPIPHRLMADVDAALESQVLDVP
jgi:hypothetical protein